MTCREFVESLLEYVDGHLEAPARRAVDDHMAACPDCVRYVQHYTETVKAGSLSMAGDDASTEVPEALVQAIVREMKASGR